MIEAEQVQDGGVQVVDGGDVLDGLVAELVGGAVAEAALDAGAGQPDGEAVRVVVAAAGALLERRHAAELGDPDDERVVEQAAAVSGRDQSAAQGWSRIGRVDVVLRLERLVAVPVADAFAHGVGAVEELHEAHAALDAAAGRGGNCVAKPALSWLASFDAVELEHVRGSRRRGRRPRRR